MEEIYLKNNQVCRLWDIPRKTLKEWVMRGLPCEGKSKYPLFLCNDWVKANTQKFGESEGASLNVERTELVRVQRQLKTLDLTIKRGELIPRSDVLDEFLARIHVVRSGLLGFSRSLPQVLYGRELRDIAEILKKEVSLLLEKFSRKGGILKK